MPARLLLAMLLSGATGLAAQPIGRLRPPAAVDCPRDQLTLYSGMVLRYQREARSVRLLIETDAGTREAVVLEHAGSESPRPWFLIEGRAFDDADWPRIELAPGRLRPGTRVAAWICADGRAPVLDWHSPREP